MSSAHAVIPKKKNRVLELVRYEAKCSTVGTVVGEMTATKQHTAPWEKSTPNISLKIKSPLSPQVHTADVSRDLRRHMDKLARLANI